MTDEKVLIIILISYLAGLYGGWLLFGGAKK